MAKGSLLSIPYPNPAEWRQILNEFSSSAIAHKLLLAHTPYVFRDEPLKYALFRRTIADAFSVAPTNIFIVGSAMAGRSLKGRNIDKAYSKDSDIDCLIVSEHLFATYVMRSLEWVQSITKPAYSEELGHPVSPDIKEQDSKHIGWLSMFAGKGIWRPDSLPAEADARREFFEKFGDVSLKVLGLQLSEDTVSHVTGRIARSFDDAVGDLASSIARLGRELDEIDKKAVAAPETGPRKPKDSPASETRR